MSRIFLQDLSPASTSLEYNRSRVRDLPQEVTGNSLRVEAINQASSRSVSPYAVIAHGGHDCTNQSASFEYHTTTPMSAMPGNRSSLDRILQRTSVHHKILKKPCFSMHAVAMALAGYPSHYYTAVTSFHVPASPNLGTIPNGSNEQMINNFINHLFNVLKAI